jgi:type VI secretion system protein ImpE
MTAGELFHAGRLADAIDAQIAKVKSNPADNRARLFLFELFLFTGELDRARKQLDVLRYDDQNHMAAVAQYRDALEAEAKRRAVFAGTADPECLTVAPEHVHLRLAAIKCLARNEPAEARKRLDEATVNTPKLSGTCNGRPFDGWTDADERFGTVLEILGTGGVYAWVPLEAVESVTLNPPSAPRDIVWRPARLVTKDGIDGDVLLPGLYPNTHESADDELKLGRATDWLDGLVHRGVGGKLFQTVAGDTLPLAMWTELQFQVTT